MDIGYLFLGLFRGLAYSSLVVLAYSLAWRNLKTPRVAAIVASALFGLIGIGALSDQVHYANGAVYDGSVPVIALAYGFLGTTGVVIVGITVLAVAAVNAAPDVYLEAGGLIATIVAGIAVTRLPDRFFTFRWSRPALLGLLASLPMVAIHFFQASEASAYASAFLFLMVNAAGVMLLHDLLSNERERIARFRTLQEDASLDPLTRLSNRRSFLSRATAALDLLSRSQGSFAVMMIDVDHFKTVNDTHGHDVGDGVLIAIAQTISKSVRQSDIVARFGGEEFAILLPGAGPDNAKSLGEAVRLAIQQSASGSNEMQVPVTVSIGVAAGSAGRTALDSALRHADGALYSAKRNGRNRVEHVIAAL